MVCSSSGLPVVSRKTGKSCQFPMKTFTAAVILRRIYSVKLISALHYFRQPTVTMWLLSVRDYFPLGVCNWGRLNIAGVQGIQSPRLHGFSSCFLPIARKCSKFPISHRHLTTISRQMQFLTPLTTSCWLPANTVIKNFSFIHYSKVV